MGILPEALLNYLVRLGWSHGDQEIFSIQELIGLFDLKHINKSAAAINPEKLIWLNQHYLTQSQSKDLVPLVKEQMRMMSINMENGPDLELLCEIQKERVKTLEELAMQSKYFYEDFEHYEEKAAKKHLRAVIQEPMLRIRNALDELNEWSAEGIHSVIETVASELDIKLGKVAQPLRVAVTGTGVSPSIDKTLLLVGRERVRKRLDKALEYIRSRAQLDSGQSVT
jgi:glutamyl-tRNA synthetase